MTAVSTHAAALRVRAGIGGEPVIQEMQASGAMTFQPAPWGVWLIGSSAHPTGGDDLRVKVTVGVGCCLDVRSHTPTVARSGPVVGKSRRRVPSTSRISVNVGADAMLAWCPEPGIATKDCDHLCEAEVHLCSSSRLAWRDEFLIDRRFPDRSGTWRSRLRITRDSWPVVSSELALGVASELWESPAVLEGARAVSHLVVVDPGQPSPTWQSCRSSEGSATGAALPLAGPGVKITAWGDHLADCRAVVEDLLGRSGVPAWAQSRWEASIKAHEEEPEPNG